MIIIVISSADEIENEPHVITKLFENGLEHFHLRKPKYSTGKLKEYIAAIPPQFHNRIIIHTHHILARRFNLKGIHLTKTHKRRKYKTWLMLKYFKIKRPGMMLTTSFNKIASLFEDEYKYDYVFLSPVFDSLTRKYQSGFTDHSLRSALEKTPFKVVARGGVQYDTFEKAKDLGFYGVALYTAIWKKPDPVEEFVKIMEKCRADKQKVDREN